MLGNFRYFVLQLFVPVVFYLVLSFVGEGVALKVSEFTVLEWNRALTILSLTGSQSKRDFSVFMLIIGATPLA